MPRLHLSRFLAVAIISGALAGPSADGRPDDLPFSALNLPSPTPWRLADGNPGPEYWQQRVDYSIDATLDEATETIRGRASVTYVNNSPQALDFVWLHLEQNLFRAGSLAERSSLPGARFSNQTDFKGGIEVSSITSGGVPVKYVVYDTMARLDLAAPIAAKPRGGGEPGRFTFDIEWTFRIPSYGVDRMGIEPFEQGKVFQIAQWFPAVAVYDDVHGWNTLPYLGQGEFYTNFGTYDVRLTVPRSHITVATGVLRNPHEVLTRTQIERLERARGTAETVMIRSAEEVGDPASRPAGEGPLTWHFTAEDVRTVAFASSASFIWDAAGVNGRPATLAQSVYPKEASGVWSRSTDMLRFAIEGYNTKWFEYPYPTATNVFGNVGGMEYPMIIFCGDRGSDEGLYGVTTHEIGHNWFPMIVNTDERRHAWMDEGFNSFINIYSEAERFHNGVVKRNGRDFAHLVRPGLPPMDTPPDQLGPGLLGALQYAKTAVALYLLREEVMGPERFDRAFREYIRRWAFKSPRPADFYRTMENVGGMDLAWFWRGWITEARSLDQAVTAVEQRSDAASASITFQNVGDMVMPLRYRVTFDDATTADGRLPVEVWYWTNEWKTDVPTAGKKVVKIVVDPDLVMPDIDPRNNTWEPAMAPPPQEAPPDGGVPAGGEASRGAER
jgi:hypothetical protein